MTYTPHLLKKGMDILTIPFEVTIISKTITLKRTNFLESFPF